MSHIASVLRPHNIGLGLSINSICESKSLAVSSDPTCAPAYRNTPWAAVLTDMGTYVNLSPNQPHGGWPHKPGDPTDNMSYTTDMSSCPQWRPPGNDPAVMQYCGFEGRVMNLLHSPRATIHKDRWPQLAPAIWLGGCYANGSTPTQQGWTRASLRAFLAFLDAQHIPRIGIWCMAFVDKHGLQKGGACPCPGVESDNVTGAIYCPWQYEELRAWRTRPLPGS
eukprot:SAG22_NODE_3095_length_1946_cov_1.397401_2_plen_223_part_00